MARVSRRQADQHRKDIVAAASRLYREKGVGRVSVPELMAAVGLTHGGFYGHFPSKDALAAEAFGQAFADMNARLAALPASREGEAAAGVSALADDYLSLAHRDHPEAGCAAAGLLEFPLDTDNDAVRDAYAAGVAGMLSQIERLQGVEGEAGRPAAMATLATLVGSLLVARATRGTPFSEAFLATDRLLVTESQNVATDTAALIIPSVGSSHERHARLQRFMLANDAATIAVEVPIWLDEDDIADLEDQHGIVLAPKRPVHPGRPTGPHWPRSITGHIDFLQVRGGAVHSLDYKPDAHTNKPVAQLTIYALGFSCSTPSAPGSTRTSTMSSLRAN